MREKIDEINNVQSGTVRIGIFSSVAINWLPDIFTKFQEDYPKINCEMLLGDYDEIEKQLEEGRIDCAFLRLPTNKNFDTTILKKDEYKAVLPYNHPLADKEFLEYDDLNNQPFLLLEHGGKTEVSDMLEQNNVKANIRFTTWEDFAIMAMVEKGLGIGILPELILKRIPYNIVIKSFKKPYYRKIVLATKDKNNLTAATRKFIEYLKYIDI